MKRSNLLAGCLFAMMLILPIMVFFLPALGYHVIVVRPFVFSVLFTVVYFAVGIALLRAKDKQISRFISVLIGLLFPVAALNVYLWMSKCGDIFATAMCMLCLLLSAVISLTRSNHRVMKIIAAVIAVVLLLPLPFTALMHFTFGQIGVNTVVETVASPAGTYYAEVIDSDQGALGGDTIVDVYESDAQLDLFLMKFEKIPQRVYVGDWGEFMDMQIYWESENVLMIDGNRYSISK